MRPACDPSAMTSHQPFRDVRATAAKVLATEALVIAALWVLGRYFSS
jgi:hypothetical protein